MSSAVGLDEDEVKLLVSAVRLPKGYRKQTAATEMAHACSPMYQGELGRAGLILWGKALVAYFMLDKKPNAAARKMADDMLLAIPKCITRQDEDALTKEILGTWEAYS